MPLIRSFPRAQCYLALGSSLLYPPSCPLHGLIELSTKQPLFMDNFHFCIALSTKQPLFVDNFHFCIVLSTKLPLFMDNFHFCIVLSTKQPLFMDKYLLNWTTAREIGTKPIFGLKYILQL